MSHTWKLLPLAAVFALGLVVLVPGGLLSGTARKAYAAQDCTQPKRTVSIQIVDNNTGDFISVPGTTVVISPNPAIQDIGGSRTYIDNGSNDADTSDTGIIQATGVCQNDGGYTVSLTDLPGTYNTCDFPGDKTVIVGSTNPVVNFVLTNCPSLTPTTTATTTATPTTTVGPATGLTISASPATLGCNGTSIITVQVKDASGNAVAAGTAVTLTSSQGSVAPTSGTTASDGSLFVFFSATGNANGAVTVGATSGSATGTATVTVNCSAVATATTAPPPTVAPTVSGGGVISPPNTGSAGLANSDNGIGWQTYGGIALVIMSALGALVLVRSRVRD